MGCIVLPIKLFQIFQNSRHVYFSISGFQHFGMLSYVLLTGSKFFLFEGEKVLRETSPVFVVAQGV